MILGLGYYKVELLHLWKNFIVFAMYNGSEILLRKCFHTNVFFHSDTSENTTVEIMEFGWRVENQELQSKFFMHHYKLICPELFFFV